MKSVISKVGASSKDVLSAGQEYSVPCVYTAAALSFILLKLEICKL